MMFSMPKKKIVGYCRVSTLEQKKKGFGIDVQVREIQKFARDNGITIDRIFKDEAVSGLEEARRELDILLNLCQKGEVKAVIFPSTDRTARSVRISENLYYELNKNNVRIYFADMPYYDHDNYGDVMVRQIKEVIAEGNRNAIVDRLKKGREERIRKGKPPGGTVPYGYHRRRKKWLVYSSEAAIIRLIFDLHQNNEKPLRIAQILNNQGLKRRNGKGWTARQVAEILGRKELYKQGIFHYGEVKGQNKKLVILDIDQPAKPFI
jgi:site-specific DNA recombinase